MAETSQHKDQFVIAYLTSLQDADRTTEWAIHFAKLLDKGLILLHITDKHYTQISPEEAESTLQNLNNRITEIPTHTYAALKGKTKDIIHSLGEVFSAVMVVGRVNNGSQSEKNKAATPKHLIRNFSASRIAYFLFGEEAYPKPFNSVLLPLNMLREAKEKVLWASYFGRFAQSSILILYKHYRDSFHRQQLQYNLKFAADMLAKFHLNFVLEQYNGETKGDIDLLALQYAETNDCNLIICQSTRNKSIVDFFSSLQELKTLRQMRRIPILFLNPRDDLFVLCE
ncbi:MAG: hypothetical protein LBR17_09770 [Bacteroidales bacterium]|jgi:hypothetical protein|nr:hypothetical protein [Bacteroidales bacterium]